MNKEVEKGLVPKIRFKEFRDAWNVENFKDLTEVLRCGIASTPIYVEKGVPFLSAQNVNSEGELVLNKYNFISEEFYKELSKNHKLKKGDLLYSRVGAGFGNAAVFELEGNYGVYVSLTHIRPSKKLDNYFLKFLLNCDVGQKQADVGVVKGGGVPNLNVKAVEKFKIPFPSIPEQTKIAACLSSLDDLITAQTQKIEALKTHKKGLMQQLFPQEGETVPMLRFPEFSGDWVETTLIKIAKFRRGSFPQPYGLPEWYDDTDGMPFIQVFDVSDDLRLKPKTKNKISELAAKQSVFIPKGTVIITIQGSIGRVAITQYDAYIDRTLLLFEKFLKPMEKLFFAYVLQILFEIEKEKAPGGIIKTITKEVLSEFKIRYPSEEEQQKIADCLSSLDDLINDHVKKCELLKTHKKGLMQGLFPSSNEAA